MLTTAQAAELLGVERTTILQWIRRKHLRATKFGRDWFINATPDELKQVKLNRVVGRPRKLLKPAGGNPAEKE